MPRDLGPTERYPLLVWPVFGDWLNTLVLNDLDYIEKYRFFILVIGASHEGFDEILREIVSKHPVDQNRVYVSGASRGGWVCWNIAMRYPELVAAVAPMGAPRADVSLTNKLVNIPIWAFHSRDETYIPRAGTEEMVAAIKSAGGNVYLTLLPSTSHDCWTTAFQAAQYLSVAVVSTPWIVDMLGAARHAALEMAAYPDRAICILHDCGVGMVRRTQAATPQETANCQPPGIQKQSRAAWHK